MLVGLLLAATTATVNTEPRFRDVVAGGLRFTAKELEELYRAAPDMFGKGVDFTRMSKDEVKRMLEKSPHRDLLATTSTGTLEPGSLESITATDLKKALGKGHARGGRDYAMGHDMVAVQIQDLQEANTVALATQKEEFEEKMKELVAIFKTALPNGNKQVYEALEKSPDFAGIKDEFKVAVDVSQLKKEYEDAKKKVDDAVKLVGDPTDYEGFVDAMTTNGVDTSKIDFSRDPEAGEKVLLKKITKFTPATTGNASQKFAADLKTKRDILKSFIGIFDSADAKALKKAQNDYAPHSSGAVVGAVDAV